MLRVFICYLLGSENHRADTLSQKAKYGEEILQLGLPWSSGSACNRQRWPNMAAGRHLCTWASGPWGRSERWSAKGAGSIMVGSWGGSLAAGESHFPVVHPATTFLGGEFRNDTPESMHWLLSLATEKLCTSGYSLWLGSFRNMTVHIVSYPTGCSLDEWNVSLNIKHYCNYFGQGTISSECSF